MPSITIDKQFFRKSLDDYNNWQLAQPRELLQNSVDCGSRNIDFVVDENEDGFVRLTCTNDGPPMSEEVLVGKFMALGGTTKGTDGSVGGFGIAKLVIACAHQSYTIHTGDLILTGEGGQYEIISGEYLSGTRTSVILWGNWDVSVDRIVNNIKQVVGSSDIEASVSINGMPYTKRTVISGEPLQQFEFGNCYLIDDEKQNDKLCVRVNGLYMFEVWLSTRRAVVLELTDSKKLTSNRDSLNWSCRDEVEKYITDLAINNETNLTVRVPDITEYGDCDMAHTLEDLDRLVEDIEKTLEKAGNPENGLSGAITPDGISETQAGTIPNNQSDDASQQETRNVDVLEFGKPENRNQLPASTFPAGTAFEIQHRQNVENGIAAYGSGTSGPNTSGSNTSGSNTGWSDSAGSTNVQSDRLVVAPKRRMIKIVVANHTRIQLPDYCIPGGLSKSMRKTLSDWAGICLASASLLRIDKRFSIGYVVSDGAEALWMNTSAGNTLLMNPFEIVKIGNASWTLKNRPSMSVEDMVPLAVHEITHMQLKSKYHDESYASQLTDNMGKAYKNKKSLEKRAREISKIMFENFVW